MFFFYSPLKLWKFGGFLTFSGGIKSKHWPEIGSEKWFLRMVYCKTFWRLCIILTHLFCSDDIIFASPLEILRLLRTMFFTTLLYQIKMCILASRKWCNSSYLALCKKFPCSELFWSAFFQHFPALGLNTERYGGSLRIQS